MMSQRDIDVKAVCEHQGYRLMRSPPSLTMAVSRNQTGTRGVSSICAEKQLEVRNVMRNLDWALAVPAKARYFLQILRRQTPCREVATRF